MSGQYEAIKRLLKLFIEASGPSGYEDPVRKLVAKEVEPFADELRTDPLGNLIFVKKGSNPKAPALLIMAHMDEIGMMVKYIDAQGFIRFSYMGGFFDQITLGQRVVVRTAKGNLPGVIGSKPPHLMKADERKKVFAKYCIDGETMKLADTDAIILHCLPAHYGDEIDYATSRLPNSAIFDQAENRMHAQKALMLHVAGD